MHFTFDSFNGCNFRAVVGAKGLKLHLKRFHVSKAKTTLLAASMGTFTGQPSITQQLGTIVKYILYSESERIDHCVKCNSVTLFPSVCISWY